jgi:hypothetical protein
VTLRLGLVLAVSALAACGSASGRGGDMGGGPSLPMCPAYPHGMVTLLETASSTSMVSVFQKSGSRTCMTATSDSCSALIFAPLAGDAGMPPIADAGVISVSGGAMPIMLTPQSGGGYAPFHGMSPLWSGGEPITISAAGGERRHFAATTTAPGAATLTMPAERPTTIARGSDLSLSWSGSGIGVVEVLLSASSAGMPAVEVHCRYPLAAGHGVVPAAILGNLPAGSMGALVMTTLTPQTLSAGGSWSVDVALETVAVDQSGASVSSSVTFN